MPVFGQEGLVVIGDLTTPILGEEKEGIDPGICIGLTKLFGINRFYSTYVFLLLLYLRIFIFPDF